MKKYIKVWKGGGGGGSLNELLSPVTYKLNLGWWLR